MRGEKVIVRCEEAMRIEEGAARANNEATGLEKTVHG